ncbi:MAG: hypothetical protein JSV96_17050 [Candidatus Aminicenantes bacterium]|nr:MAG: hypothetical protein JSV96_17050 [Candidatus Aminicenantes bacterium]
MKNLFAFYNTNFMMKGVKNPEKIFIYAIALTLFILQSYYFAEKNDFRYPPDEPTHISYICHLKTTSSILPDFEKFVLYSESGDKTNRPITLAHPPFYYHLMKYFAPENPKDIMREFKRLRYVNIAISSIGVLICFFLCFRINLPLSFHILYSISLISIPMLSYLAGSVNNDNLAFVGGSIALLGGVYLLENRKIAFYLLGMGVLISLLTKATAGLQVLIFFFIIFCYWVWSNKRLNFSIHMIFLIFSVILPLIYYILMKFLYGTVLPRGQGDIALPSRYVNTLEYINHFFVNLWTSWSSIKSHHSIVRHSIFDTYPYLIVLILSIFGLLFIYQNSISLKINKNIKNIFIVSKIGFVSLAIFMVVHFIRAYMEYLDIGYLGGLQARYYFPLISSVFILAYLPLLGKSKKLPIFSFLLIFLILFGFLYSNFYYFFFIY